MHRATVRLARPEDRADDEAQDDAAAELTMAGRAFVGPVEAGVFDLVLAVARADTGTRDALRRRVTLEPGENHLSIASPPLGLVRIEGAPPASAQVYAATHGPSEQAGYVQRDAASGAYVADMLPPGAHVVVFQGDGERFARP